MKFWQVDSFTTKPFGGNPAAVFVLDADIADDLKQAIAMEMNLAETAFGTLGDHPRIRWFTPNTEVNLCGHATLAAAHILWEQGFIDRDTIVLDSLSGSLGVSRNANGYTLDFPAQPATARPEHMPKLTDILGQAPLYAGSNGEDCLALVESSAFVKAWKPDLTGIASLPERGLLVTAHDESGEYDFVYRAFFPRLGIDEDPVTGSANTSLVPFWSERLGRATLKARQVSKRGGDLILELAGERVLITGQAVTVFEGEMSADAH